LYLLFLIPFIGRVIEGMKVVRAIENVPVLNSKPKLAVVISECKI